MSTTELFDLGRVALVTGASIMIDGGQVTAVRG